jgi:hypothetical protein
LLFQPPTVVFPNTISASSVAVVMPGYFCIRSHSRCFRCFAAAEDDANRAIELSKDKNDPTLLRLLKSIQKARSRLVATTADYMSPPAPAEGTVVGSIPSYYSLDVSDYAVGTASGGGQAADVKQASESRGTEKQQHVLHQHQSHLQQQQQQQQLASPQVSQESLGTAGTWSADSTGVGAITSRSLEILQVNACFLLRLWICFTFYIRRVTFALGVAILAYVQWKRGHGCTSCRCYQWCGKCQARAVIVHRACSYGSGQHLLSIHFLLAHGVCRGDAAAVSSPSLLDTGQPTWVSIAQFFEEEDSGSSRSSSRWVCNHFGVGYPNLGQFAHHATGCTDFIFYYAFSLIVV